MNLDTTNWKEFSLNKLFIIKKGKRLTSEDQEDGVYNYIGAIDSNNGIANHIAQQPIHEGNTISLSYNGSVGEAFYQKDPYWATDDVNALYSRYDGFNEPIGLFIATVIRAEKYKFSYGRKWTLENMQKSIIKLPVRRSSDGKPFIDKMHMYSDEGYVPDWQFMEQYVRSLHHKPLTTKNKCTKVAELNIDTWKEFKIGKIFQTNIAKSIDFGNTESGCNVYVGRTSSNNGVQGYVSDPTVENGNCIIIGMVGENWAFYQPAAFVASQNILVLRTPQLNCCNALFLCSILSKSVEIFRMNYALPLSKEKMNQRIIKLPIQRREDGSPVIDINYQYSDEGYVPDWQFMEDYIKSLPYGDRL